jgi:hypothetical protein
VALDYNNYQPVEFTDDIGGTLGPDEVVTPDRVILTRVEALRLAVSQTALLECPQDVVFRARVYADFLFTGSPFPVAHPEDPDAQ